jgi:hypothetical protein
MILLLLAILHFAQACTLGRAEMAGVKITKILMPKHEPIKLDIYVFDLAHAQLLFLSVYWFRISFEHHNNHVNRGSRWGGGGSENQ